MQNYPKPERQQLLEVYTLASGDAAEKIGFITRPIKSKNPQISFIYGQAFYAKVEQLFLHHLGDEIEELITFFNILLQQQMNNLIQQEQFQLQVIINWLQTISAFMNETHDNYSAFRQFYNKVFYYDVFREFDERMQYGYNNSNMYIEDCLCFASSSIIMSYLAQPCSDPNVQETKAFQSFIIFGNGEENYLSLTTNSKIESLTEALKVGMRVYLDKVDELIVFRKSAITGRYALLSATYIYDFASNEFRIGYDMNYQMQFQFYMYKKNHIKIMNEEVQIGISAIQSVVQSIDDAIKVKQQKINTLESTRDEEVQKIKNIQANLIQIQQSIQQQNQQFEKEREELTNLYQEEKQLMINLEQMQIQQKTQEEINEQKKLKQEQFEKFQHDTFISQLQQQKVQQMYLQQYHNQNMIQYGGNQVSIDQSSMLSKPINSIDFSQTNSLESYQSRKYLCQICDEKIDISQMILLRCCKYMICKVCLTNHFSSNLETTQKRVLICPSCSKPVTNIAELNDQGVISEKTANLLKLRLTYECPKCNVPFMERKLENKDYSDTIKTPCCQTELCKSCQQPAHNLDQKVCKVRLDQYIETIKIFISTIDAQITEKENHIQQLQAQGSVTDKQNEELMELKKEKRFRFCPNCSTLFFKDNKCEHLACPTCKLELCFYCCAPRAPIMAHDSQFHRQACKYFRPGPEISDKDKCVPCKKSKCQHPPSWEAYLQGIIDKFGKDFFSEEFKFNWDLN